MNICPKCYSKMKTEKKDLGKTLLIIYTCQKCKYTIIWSYDKEKMEANIIEE